MKHFLFARKILQSKRLIKYKRPTVNYTLVYDRRHPLKFEIKMVYLSGVGS